MKRNALGAIAVIMALGLCALSAPAASIQLGNAIDGVTPTGSGDWINTGTWVLDEWVYDFGGGDANLADNTYYHNGQAYVRLTNVANVTSSGGGTFDKGGSYNDYSSTNPNTESTGDLVIEASGYVDIDGYLDATNSDTHASPYGGSISITAPTSIDIGDNGSGISITTKADKRGSNTGTAQANVTLYSQGAITLSGGIEVPHGGGVRDASDVPTTFIGWSGGDQKAGNVTIGGDLLLHGGGATGGMHLDIRSSGMVLIQGGIDLHASSGGVHYTDGGSLNIIGDAGVQIDGDILTDLRSGGSKSTTDGGDATITSANGDISLGGVINLETTTTNGNSHNGTLALTAPNGTITLYSGLDLSKVLKANFDASDSTSYILGVLLGADGLAADGSNIGNLQTPFGDTIYYDPSQNPGLLGGTYTLADLDGNAGAGGELAPAPVPEPATLALLGLGALGLVASRRRRRGA